YRKWAPAGKSFAARFEIELSRSLTRDRCGTTHARTGAAARSARTAGRFLAQRQPAPLRTGAGEIDGEMARELAFSRSSFVRALLIDREQTPRTARVVEIISRDKTFHWRMPAPDFQGESDLIGNGVKATLVIPVGWTDSLNKGDPKPLPLYLDDSDTNTATAVEGAVQKNLGTFQSKERDLLVESLPEEVI